MNQRSSWTRRPRWVAGQAFIVGVTVIVTILVLLPVVWMIGTAIRPIGEILSYPPHILPQEPTLRYFSRIINDSIYQRYFLNSLIIALATLVVTQLLNLALVPWLGHAGLALAISLGACFNAGWLWFLMARAGAWRPEPGWAAFLLKLAVALYLMGGAIWYTMGREASWFEIAAGARAAKLALVILAGTVAYFAALAMMGFRMRDFTRQT